MTQREVIVKVEREIGEVLSKATGDTTKILKKSKRDLAEIISKLPKGVERLSNEQRLKVFEVVVKRLNEVPATDALKMTTNRWVMDLLEWV